MPLVDLDDPRSITIHWSPVAVMLRPLIQKVPVLPSTMYRASRKVPPSVPVCDALAVSVPVGGGVPQA